MNTIQALENYLEQKGTGNISDIPPSSINITYVDQNGEYETKLTSPSILLDKKPIESREKADIKNKILKIWKEVQDLYNKEWLTTYTLAFEVIQEDTRYKIQNIVPCVKKVYIVKKTNSPEEKPLLTSDYPYDSDELRWVGWKDSSYWEKLDPLKKGEDFTTIIGAKKVWEYLNTKNKIEGNKKTTHNDLEALELITKKIIEEIHDNTNK